MTIDPKTLEVGDVVTMTGTVKRTAPAAIQFAGTSSGLTFDDAGTISGLMITKVEKPVKPFDWKDVKPGMGFIFLKKVVHYVGDALEDSGYVVVRMPENYVYLYDGIHKCQLTRATEHDLPEVKS